MSSRPSPLSPEPTGRQHSSRRSHGLIQQYNLALEEHGLAGVLPTGIAQKDLEKLKKGSPPPSEPYSCCCPLSCCPDSRSDACGSWETERMLSLSPAPRTASMAPQRCHGLRAVTGQGARGARFSRGLRARRTA